MSDTILYTGESDYSTYKVIERTYNGRRSRMLLSNNDAPQSGMALDDEPELLFDYIQRLFEVALSLQPKRVLVIGGGAFTLPTALLERLNIKRLDVVEIDPLLPTIAQDYFALPDDSRLHIHTIDGRTYIDTTTEQYDLIIIDAFSEFTIPHTLLTIQAADRYQQILTARGVVAINFIARYWGFRCSLTHQLLATFNSVFPQVELYPSDMHDSKRDEQNLLLITQQAPGTRFDYLQSSAVEPNYIPQGDIRLSD